MKKEIVIAAYRERIDWLADHWRPMVTIYRCGEPTQPSAQKASRGPHHHGDDLYAQLDRMRAVMAFVREMAELSGQPDPTKEISTHAEKDTANCSKGREAEQWLNHIIWRYDTLADVTVFLQGHPHDHCHDFKEVVEALENVTFCTLPRTPAPSTVGAEAEFCGKFWQQLGQVELQKVWWKPGAQFAASKEAILSRPREWYEQVQKLARKTDRSGEILERTWWNILGCPGA
jgi:hypothetical protein